MEKNKKMTNKNIIFSFDDGRKDTYDVAYKIMKENNIVATIHIVTGYTDGSCILKEDFASGNNEFMSINDVQDMNNNGFEISSHSDDHSNEYDKIKLSLNKLVNANLMDKDFLTFSSPHSDINEKNYKQYGIEKLNLSYLRTGMQMKNEKFLKKVAYIFQKVFKSKVAFYYLNKDNIITPNSNHFVIKSISVKKFNTFQQLEYMIKKLKNNETIVFLFHSINNSNEINDDWGYYVENFKKLCEYINNNQELNNCTIKEFIKNYN